MPNPKKLILHIGFPKTGSSALQSFMSASVPLLARAGVHYPSPEPQSYIDKGLCSGNIVQLLYDLDYVDTEKGVVKYHQDFNRLFDHMIEAARQSDKPCTLFSGEVFSQFPEEHVALLAEKTRDFDVSVVAFVRDPFDFVCSSWKQRVKRSGACDDFRQDVETRTRAGDIEMLDGYRNFDRYFQDFRIINYDRSKKDVISAFLNTCGIALDRERPAAEASGRIFNKSLTASQANLIIQINREFKGSLIGALFVEFLLRQPSQSRDTFYDRETHAGLLEAYRATLASINLRLPAGEALATTPRDSTESSAHIDPQDIAHLLAFFKQTLRYRPNINPLRKLMNLALRLFWRRLPLNFDPASYALLNPDLPRRGTNLYAHYIKQGREEGRPYRLKGLEKGFQWEEREHRQ